MTAKEFFKQFLRKYLPVTHGLIVRLRLLIRAYSRYGFDPWILRLFWTIEPYTMVGHARLLNVYDLAGSVEDGNLEGAFVECGVWNGGCAAIMAAVAERRGGRRSTWLFDSFEGLPEPTIKDGPKAASYANQNVTGKLISIKVSIGSFGRVGMLFFRILKLPHKSIHIIKGWFQETLPSKKNEIGPIAILRLDADWYESTKCVLNNLYDSVVHGGYVIIDDYGSWEGCRKAVDEFLVDSGVKPAFSWIDASGIYFKKP